MVINLDERRMINMIQDAHDLITKESQAHSEIVALLPGGIIVQLPAKNPQMLEEYEEILKPSEDPNGPKAS